MAEDWKDVTHDGLETVHVVPVTWAHSSPAPVFVNDGEPRQGGLFS